MKSSEEAHKLTDVIYRNLTENFTCGVRQLVVCSRNYHKALLGVSTTAKVYSDTLAKVGHDAKTICKGATQEIGALLLRGCRSLLHTLEGEAILQIAEVQKEIQSQIEEKMKAVLNELIVPLENKLEGEFKNMMLNYKKYSQDHKAIVVPFEKAQCTLNKLKKKSKSKFTYSEKEAKYVQTVSFSQAKLGDYRVQGLKLALLDERKSYCYLLDRLCAISSLDSFYYSKAHNLLHQRLQKWRYLCSHPHNLPDSSQQLLQFLPDENKKNYHNTFPYLNSNGCLPRETDHIGGIRSIYADHYVAQGEEYQQNNVSPRFFSSLDQNQKNTLSKSMTLPPPPPQEIIKQVRAVHSRCADGDTQLNFAEDDIIVMMGNQAEGWHYGFNTKSKKYGWFPLSFTETMESNLREMQRVKSLGDLVDQPPFVSNHLTTQQYFDNEVLKRQSFQENSYPINSMQSPQSTAAVMGGENHVEYTEAGQGTQTYFVHDAPIYHTLPTPYFQESGGDLKMTEPYNIDQQHRPPSASVSSSHSSTASNSVHPPVLSHQKHEHIFTTPSTLKRTTSVKYGPDHPLHGRTYSSSLSPTQRALPPLTSANSHFSQIPAADYSAENMLPTNSPSPYLHTQQLEYQSNGRSASPPLPPPPLMSALPPPPPTIDYEEISSYERNGAFSSIKLKKTVTNDRSGPRIN